MQPQRYQGKELCVVSLAHREQALTTHPPSRLEFKRKVDHYDSVSKGYGLLTLYFSISCSCTILVCGNLDRLE